MCIAPDGVYCILYVALPHPSQLLIAVEKQRGGLALKSRSYSEGHAARTCILYKSEIINTSPKLLVLACFFCVGWTMVGAVGF